MVKQTKLTARKDTRMQAIGETIFDIVYLITVITMGSKMMIKGKGHKQYRLFGMMAIILGFGDAFHLVPRMIALCTTGLENYTVSLGVGKLITSITMTIFYILLYHFWRLHYEVKGYQNISYGVYLLGGIRIALCLFPQNKWISTEPSLTWGIYRNIPFVLLGIWIIVLFYKSAKRHQDKMFGWMWLAIVLSFAFYVPVVLWSHTIPMVGMLMIPKTCAYVWIVAMGYSDMLHNEMQSDQYQ